MKALLARMVPGVLIAFVLLGLVLIALRVAPGTMGGLSRAARRFSRRHGWCALTVGVAAAAVSAVVGLLRPPLPAVHDEFSYLLAADTFARGRLTNPTHPMWEHFESFHVIHRPTYASKYPPAQGLILALGQVLTGRPIVGVWISAGLAAAAVCWMLQGWAPGRWALLGGMLVAFHPAVQLAWNQGYWGGSVAMLGGALLFGAWPRIVRRARARDAVALAVGLVVLANSRPFEGLVAALPVALALVVWLARGRRPALGRVALRIALPAAGVLSVAAAAMLHYNARVTGDPWKLPYQVWNETYSRLDLLGHESEGSTPVSRHDVIRAGAERSERRRREFATLEGWLRVMGFRALNVWFFYLGTVALTVSLAALPWAIRARRARRAAGVLVLAFGAGGACVYFHPHYLAPVAPLIFLLAVECIRRMAACARRAGTRGRALVYALVASYFVCFALAASLHAAKPAEGMGWQRARVAARLEQAPGQHLVLVRYGPRHVVHDEWVYNAADIDAARVVWAKDLGPEKNRKLLDYFKDRKAWLLEPDASPPRMKPYRAISSGPDTSG